MPLGLVQASVVERTPVMGLSSLAKHQRSREVVRFGASPLRPHHEAIAILKRPIVKVTVLDTLVARKSFKLI